MYIVPDAPAGLEPEEAEAFVELLYFEKEKPAPDLMENELDLIAQSEERAESLEQNKSSTKKGSTRASKNDKSSTNKKKPARKTSKKKKLGKKSKVSRAKVAEHVALEVPNLAEMVENEIEDVLAANQSSMGEASGGQTQRKLEFQPEHQPDENTKDFQLDVAPREIEKGAPYIAQNFVLHNLTLVSDAKKNSADKFKNFLPDPSEEMESDIIPDGTNNPAPGTSTTYVNSKTRHYRKPNRRQSAVLSDDMTEIISDMGRGEVNSDLEFEEFKKVRQRLKWEKNRRAQKEQKNQDELYGVHSFHKKPRERYLPPADYKKFELLLQEEAPKRKGVGFWSIYEKEIEIPVVGKVVPDARFISLSKYDQIIQTNTFNFKKLRFEEAITPLEFDRQIVSQYTCEDRNRFVAISGFVQTEKEYRGLRRLPVEKRRVYRCQIMNGEEMYVLRPQDVSPQLQLLFDRFYEYEQNAALAWILLQDTKIKGLGGKVSPEAFMEFSVALQRNKTKTQARSNEKKKPKESSIKLGTEMEDEGPVPGTPTRLKEFEEANTAINKSRKDGKETSTGIIMKLRSNQKKRRNSGGDPHVHNASVSPNPDLKDNLSVSSIISGYGKRLNH